MNPYELFWGLIVPSPNTPLNPTALTGVGLATR
jgi:hypothetical protein